MKSATVICALVVMSQALYATAAGGNDRQQPLFFQAGRPFNAPGAPLPKFVGVAGGQPPHAFRSQGPQVDENQEDEEQREEDESSQRNLLIPTPLPFRPQPTQQQFNQFRASPSPSPQTLQPIRINRPSEGQSRRPPPPPPQQFKSLASQPLSEEAQELEEEKEEPDRLTQLLPQSKFTCSGKKTGYYADDGLDCEVFHYCQDNARHSWICPEGFVFHQVHLICMPPSGENICKQSSQYHFVNDFLYRPVNAEEAQSRPNVTIRYGDRYYPGNNYEGDEEYDREEEAPQQRPQQFRQQPTIRQRTQQPQPQQSQQHNLSTPRPIVLQQQPQQFARQPLSNQVFHSSEEVNIPLQQRRPILQQQRPQFQQQLQQQQQQQTNDFDFERK
ncbi:transcription factor SPT20 homolog isoform X2 [Adelges cooleyi]|uniref:transcription factor SPT20 homolog isoform X2 n=1 Tax=Adelges cooleyi TaxID=133065 RepID=UPI00217F4757|nr:transcription factor SPT20 homolog isoform X2 [Adelges cooleyi]